MPSASSHIFRPPPSVLSSFPVSTFQGLIVNSGCTEYRWWTERIGDTGDFAGLKIQANPTTGCQKKLEIDDDQKLRAFYDKRISQEVKGDALGEAQELQRWKLDEERRLEEARLAEEAAMEIVERERAKSKAAMEHAEAAQRIAEMEVQKRNTAELRALKEAEEKEEGA